MQGLSKCESNPYIYVFPVLGTSLSRSLIESIYTALCRSMSLDVALCCSMLLSSCEISEDAFLYVELGGGENTI